MIPKIIHYCWLSNDPIPRKLKKCMDSWQKILPDYQWMKWDFSRFDKSSSQWVSEAFDNHKYAFAADYIRLYALYNYGGWYLDMDVEAVKSLDPFQSLKTAICWQAGDDNGLEVAAFGVEKGCQWIKDCLSYYENRHFKKPDGSFDTRPLPIIVEEQLRKAGYKLSTASNIKEALSLEKEVKAIPILTYDYFSPKNYDDLQLYPSWRTTLIHHFAGSWLTFEARLQHSHPQLYKWWYWCVFLPKYEWRTKVISRIR